MYIIKHPIDLSQLPSGSPERDLLEVILTRLIEAYATYNPDEHGYVVLIEAHDVYRQAILPELPCALAKVPWEGVTLEGNYFHAVVLTNNDFGIDFIIPDAKWQPETLRASLEQHLSQD